MHLEGKLNRDTLEVCSQDGQWDILNRVCVIHPAEDQALCKTKCPMSTQCWQKDKGYVMVIQETLASQAGWIYLHLVKLV